MVSSLPSQPPIHHPFHHTDSHIPHFHYLRRMVLLGLPRLIADCRDSLFNPPQSHPKCSTITLVCNTECKKDSNMTRNDESHESRFTRHEPYGGKHCIGHYVHTLFIISNPSERSISPTHQPLLSLLTPFLTLYSPSDHVAMLLKMWIDGRHV